MISADISFWLRLALRWLSTYLMLGSFFYPFSASSSSCKIPAQDPLSYSANVVSSLICTELAVSSVDCTLARRFGKKICWQMLVNSTKKCFNRYSSDFTFALNASPLLSWTRRSSSTIFAFKFSLRCSRSSAKRYKADFSRHPWSIMLV